MSSGTKAEKVQRRDELVEGVAAQPADTARVGRTESGAEPTAQQGTEGDAKARRADLAYARVLNLLRSLPDASLVHINFDIPSLVPQLLAAAQRAESRWDLFEGVQPFDKRWVTEFRDYILALVHTHSVYRVSEETVSGHDIPYLMEQRTQLYRDAERAVERGFLDPAKLENITLSNGHNEMAYDLLALAHLFLQSWGKLQGRTALTRADLEQLQDKANDQLLMLVTKNDKPTSLVEIALDRRRAATLVFKVHRKLRFALGLVLETQEEVDAILPPLKMRTRRKGEKPVAVSAQASAEDELEQEFGNDDEPEGGPRDTLPPEDNVPRASVFTTKAATPTQAAAGIGLPGSSPVDDE